MKKLEGYKVELVKFCQKEFPTFERTPEEKEKTEQFLAESLEKLAGMLKEEGAETAESKLKQKSLIQHIIVHYIDGR